MQALGCKNITLVMNEEIKNFEGPSILKVIHLVGQMSVGQLVNF